MSLAERTLLHPALLRLLTRLHVGVYRLTRGAVGGLLSGAPVLLLETTGRRSGRRSTTPLLCLPDGGDWIVVASYGGAPNDPQWFKNLVTGSPARVEIGHHRVEVTARVISEADKPALWDVFCFYYPTYRDYQRRTQRVIPLVRLTPTR